MVKVDLITGFLGVGKTTLIMRYIEYLKSQNQKIHIIENEFGNLAMDQELLEESKDGHCVVSDLTGMCMCCVGKKEFIHLLVDAAQNGCDHIVVEPSGIYDVDEFFDVLSDARVCSLCEIGSIITVVDPFMQEGLSEEVKYLMFSQLLASGLVVVSKSQLATKEQIDSTLQWVDDLMKQKGCEAGLMADVIVTDWKKWTEYDFSCLEDAGYFRVVHEQENFSHSALFDSLEYKETFADRKEIIEKVQHIFEDKSIGNVFRVKGFVQTLDGMKYEVNCTGSFLRVDETKKQGNTLVLIGEHLKRKALLMI